MDRRLPAVIVFLVALCSVPVAEAGPIIYFDHFRSLDVNGRHFENSDAGFWSVFERADGPVTVNGLHMSTIGAQLVDGRGHPYELIRASGSLNALRSAAADLSTSLFTSFQLDSPYTANLNAFLAASDLGYAEGYFFNESTQTMLAQAMVEDGVTRLRFDGILEPGVYSYYLFTRVNQPASTNDSNGQFSGDFTLAQFTPVPEPGTLTLMGLGLAAAWRRRRAMKREV